MKGQRIAISNLASLSPLIQRDQSSPGRRQGSRGVEYRGSARLRPCPDPRFYYLHLHWTSEFPGDSGTRRGSRGCSTLSGIYPQWNVVGQNTAGRQSPGHENTTGDNFRPMLATLRLLGVYLVSFPNWDFITSCEERGQGSL